jgi:hypothetical protein
MSNVPRVGDLEIFQDMTYQRCEWIIQRVAWIVMLLIVIAAVAGLLGDGPLSRRTARDPGGTFQLEYDRFLHYGTQTTLTVRFAPRVARDGEVRLWLSLDYLDGVQVQQITPEPARVEAGPDRSVFVFRVSDPDAPATVFFHVLPQHRRPLSGRVGVGDREPLPFDQFVYP